MKKRLGLASTIVITIILILTQITFFGSVSSSDPTLHAGLADAGNLWVSEMAVSEVVNFNNIGVAHVMGSDDYVEWTRGTGTIKADWEVELGSYHPEYHVTYTLFVYHVDNNNSELGNDSHSGVYALNTSYNTHDTLEVDVIFEPECMAAPQTLVCTLYASCMVNNTAEAKNFTTIALDRSIIGVTFSPFSVPDFSDFRDNTNNDFPSIFSYIEGWEQEFMAEGNMLMGQTAAIAGEVMESVTYTLGDWKVCELTVKRRPFTSPKVELESTNIIPIWRVNDYPYALGKTYLKYDISNHQMYKPCYVVSRYFLKHDEDNIKITDNWFVCWKHCTGQGNDYAGAAVNSNHQDINGYVHLHGEAFAKSGGAEVTLKSEFDDYKVKIHPSGQNEPMQSSYRWNWQSKCAYLEGSYTVTTSGTSVVYIDISEGLETENEFIITNAADRGDTTIVLTV